MKPRRLAAFGLAAGLLGGGAAGLALTGTTLAGAQVSDVTGTVADPAATTDSTTGTTDTTDTTAADSGNTTAPAAPAAPAPAAGRGPTPAGRPCSGGGGPLLSQAGARHSGPRLNLRFGRSSQRVGSLLS